jgi:hypothetical protein
MIDINEKRLKAPESLIYVLIRETHGLVRFRAITLFSLLYLVKAII